MLYRAARQSAFEAPKRIDTGSHEWCSSPIRLLRTQLFFSIPKQGPSSGPSLARLTYTDLFYGTTGRPVVLIYDLGKVGHSRSREFHRGQKGKSLGPPRREGGTSQRSERPARRRPSCPTWRTLPGLPDGHCNPFHSPTPMLCRSNSQSPPLPLLSDPSSDPPGWSHPLDL